MPDMSEHTPSPDGQEQAAAAERRDEAGTRKDRIERMIQQARDGKTAQREAFAASGRRLGADEREPPGRWVRRPPHRGQRPRRPRRGDFDCNAERGTYPYRRRRHGCRMGRLTRRLTGAAVLLALIIAVILIFWPRLQTALTPNFAISLPDSLQGLLPDEKMGYNAVDFSNAILGESRERKELVVMEQDVEVTSQISQDLLNIALFAKQKIIRSFGTGVYTVDLAALCAEDIVLDEDTCIITVTIPHAGLSYVGVDVERTEFEDTQKALLAVGDIKLTAEQKHVLDQSVDTALHERLSDPALLTKADEIALNKARELFQAPVSALSETYVVKVVMA